MVPASEQYHAVAAGKPSAKLAGPDLIYQKIGKENTLLSHLADDWLKRLEDHQKHNRQHYESWHFIHQPEKPR